MKKAMLRKLYPVAVAADKAVDVLTSDAAHFIYAAACGVLAALAVVGGFYHYAEIQNVACGYWEGVRRIVVDGAIFAAAFFGLSVFCEYEEE